MRCSWNGSRSIAVCNDADHQAAMAFNEWKYQEGIEEYKQELRERIMDIPVRYHSAYVTVHEGSSRATSATVVLLEREAILKLLE